MKKLTIRNIPSNSWDETQGFHNVPDVNFSWDLVIEFPIPFFFHSFFIDYTLVCDVVRVGEDTTVSMRGAVSIPLGSRIGDFTSIDQGSRSCEPLCWTRFAPSGNLTDFLEPLLFGERMSGITDGDGPEKWVDLVSLFSCFMMWQVVHASDSEEIV